MKTLIISYLPSGENSNTKKLLDFFISEIDSSIGSSQIEKLDLIKNPPPTFNLESMDAYIKRNYAGQVLSSSEAQSLLMQDKLVDQFKSADIIVMAYPMHNFGMPALVKAYFDAVMQAGKTFELGKKIMANKKALTLFTSGGRYTPDFSDLKYPNWDTISVLSKINFSFMGFDEAEVVATSLRDPNTTSANFEEAKTKIRSIMTKWYK